MEDVKKFNEWRAEKLGYVYFSRLNDLIIEEPNYKTNAKEPLFDLYIDIGEGDKPTGRYFGVEIKSLGKALHYDQNLKLQYKNIPFPALLVLFDNKTDKGYYKWIKKPKENGRLMFNNPEKIEELNNDSLVQIVSEIKNWYLQKAA